MTDTPNETFNFNEINGWLEYFRRCRPVLGGTDIVCAGSQQGNRLGLAAGFAATVSGLGVAINDPLFRQIAIVFPTTVLDSQSEAELGTTFFSQVIERLSNHFAKRGDEMESSATWDALRHRIQVKVAANHQTSDLIVYIKSLPPSTAVFLMNAQLYAPEQGESDQTSTSIDSRQDERVRTHLPEDRWVQDLYHTASELALLAKNQEIFVLMLVEELEPFGGENQRLLHSIENCAVATLAGPDEANNRQSVVMKNGSRWLSMARDQKIEDVIKEIDASTLAPIDRALVTAQCLMVADRPLLSFDLIEPFLSRIMDGNVPALILTAATIASRAGRYSIALDLLRNALQKNLSSQFELTLAAEVARTLGADDEEVWVLERLTRFYPHSKESIDHKFRLCRDKESFKALATALASGSGATKFNEEIHSLYLLAKAFGEHKVPDYDKLVNNITSVLPGQKYRVILLCATHAIQRGLFSKGTALCLGEAWPAQAEEHAAWRMIDALKGLFLRGQGTRLEDGPDQSNEQIPRESLDELICQCLEFVLNHLSHNTNSESIRAGLSRVLSPEIAGLNGIVYLTHVIRNSPLADIIDADASRPFTDSLPTDEFFALWELILSNLPSPLVLGMGRLPPILKSLSLDRLLESITILLKHTSATRIIDESDVRFIQLLLHVAILIAREIKAGSVLDLVRFTAAGLSASGNYQACRNLAELCLHLSSESLSRKNSREAWLCYSDIYLRCHNPMEALIGLGCALQSRDVSITSNQRYHEIILECRILRDLNLFPFAVALIPLAREHAPYTVNPPQALAHLDYLEITLQFQGLMRRLTEIPQSDAIVEIKKLAKRLVALNQRAREGEEEILPTSLLLAQINGQLIGYEQPPDTEVQKELEISFPIVGERHASLLRAFAVGEPTAADIEPLSRALAETRYNEDFGTDLTIIALLARRALSGSAKSDNPGQVLFLLEWLSDLSVNTLESDHFTRSDSIDIAESTLRSYTTSMLNRTNFIAQQEELVWLGELDARANPSLQVKGNRYPISSEELAQFAQQISKDELEIHSIGVAGDGSLVRVSAQSGDISIAIEPTTVFDSRVHRDWGERYPYDYISIDDEFALNEVEQSLAGIGIAPKSSRRPLLLIPEVRLQNIPPNLLLVDGHIAGFGQPMAGAPSVTWLKAARESERRPSGRRKAWIPASEDTLIRLYGELADTLMHHDFEVSRDPVMPAGMRDLDVAIIGAHGGLQRENEWFRVVTDERSTRLSARDVARTVQGAGVVVLFVCSGGRLDRNPYGSASVGLPHLLLDHGCRAVIASPWPVDVRVAAHWLPTFLEALMSREKVITANYVANQNVAAQFGPNPKHSLAMNVFGDPFSAVAILHRGLTA